MLLKRNAFSIEFNHVELIWVPGYGGIRGNEISPLRALPWRRGYLALKLDSAGFLRFGFSCCCCIPIYK
ncbi:hypothetical protein FF38_02587 [Lucilia cuprina]|uniref:Uncharacterized protein n=1 Tax=Lucilia cuprina TaxID=7375 RepID=A0A0L0CRN9_LUCCU|nr:hypothetical protein FF38_02587 [Lucilia cuprina]